MRRELLRRLSNVWSLARDRGLWWSYAALRTPADEFEAQGLSRFFPDPPESQDGEGLQ